MCDVSSDRPSCIVYGPVAGAVQDRADFKEFLPETPAFGVTLFARTRVSTCVSVNIFISISILRVCVFIAWIVENLQQYRH